MIGLKYYYLIPILSILTKSQKQYLILYFEFGTTRNNWTQNFIFNFVLIYLADFIKNGCILICIIFFSVINIILGPTFRFTARCMFSNMPILLLSSCSSMVR